MTDANLKEIADRCRRMETRLTKFMEAQGFDTRVQRPLFLVTGELRIPSPAVSLQDCLAVVPGDWDPEEEIIVTHQGETILSLFVHPHKAV
tara:strand:+ start:2579 stop:2851 length:273 start_codon:yes stop_codon:yes gene_type:complete